MTTATATVLCQPRDAQDVERSRQLFDRWLDDAAPQVWQTASESAARRVRSTMRASERFLRDWDELLLDHPKSLSVLRACSVNYVSRDVLAKRIGAKPDSLDRAEACPPERRRPNQEKILRDAARELERMYDRTLLPWRAERRMPTDVERITCVSVLRDRLARSEADAVLRNLQEARQQEVLRAALDAKGYREVASLADLGEGAYVFSVTEHLGKGATKGIQLDAVVQPGEERIFVELKSAGYGTNTNKRRKEESDRAEALRKAYGEDTRYVLVLGGHFGDVFLNHMIDSDIEWVWEHDVRAGIDAALPNAR